MDWINDTSLSSAGVDIATARPLSDEVIIYTTAGGLSAVKVWQALSSNWQTLGGWPILCGDPKDIERIAEGFSFLTESTTDILARVPTELPTVALRERKREANNRNMEFLKRENPELYKILSAAHSTEDRAVKSINVSDWPVKPASGARLLHTAFDYKRQPLSECMLAVIRLTEPMNAPAYLRFGGFNDCPDASIHVAFLRDWNRRYGVVPAAITTDVIELVLPQPVLDKSEIVRIAQEQYEYCTDIVDQGTQTVENLALELWGSPVWFFWWD